MSLSSDHLYPERDNLENFVKAPELQNRSENLIKLETAPNAPNPLGEPKPRARFARGAPLFGHVYCGWTTLGEAYNDAKGASHGLSFTCSEVKTYFTVRIIAIKLTSHLEYKSLWFEIFRDNYVIFEFDAGFMR